jgi:hypothetical protein
MEAAKATGALSHRSSAEQIEYWADLGQKVSHLLNPEVILDIKAGFAKLSIEPVSSPEVNVDDVFAGLTHDRKNGTLSGKIAGGNVRYQASTNHPGMLERVSPDGTVDVGTFVDGDFKALTHP